MTATKLLTMALAPAAALASGTEIGLRRGRLIYVEARRV
jgi:hypothetical protein